jgi:pSer/pThr/pTyr-binding forkhead associated (FHA) protein
MRSCLESLDGGTNIPLDRPLTLLGRDPGCDVRIDSPRVSRHHCCVAASCERVDVRDLKSTNGTLINGRRIRASQLRPGDELEIGQLRYRLIVGPPDSVGTVNIG